MTAATMATGDTAIMICMLGSRIKSALFVTQDGFSMRREDVGVLMEPMRMTHLITQTRGTALIGTKLFAPPEMDLRCPTS